MIITTIPRKHLIKARQQQQWLFTRITNQQFHLLFPYLKLCGYSLNSKNKKKQKKHIFKCSKVLISKMKYMLVIGHFLKKHHTRDKEKEDKILLKQTPEPDYKVQAAF